MWYWYWFPTPNDQMVIMAKGIGFGKRPGDIVTDDQQENQIFKSYNGNETYPDVPYQKEEMEQLVGDIVAMASKRLALDRKAVYHRLLDHIIFAVDRMNFGLPIENPFLEEIATFYPKRAGDCQNCNQYAQRSIFFKTQRR